MSKREILQVTTLAAHLAICSTTETHHGGGTSTVRFRPASECAADAMRLQRLGRRARHMRWVDLWGFGWTPDSEDAPRIKALLEEVLSPYGLRGDVAESGVIILGLPGNTGGGEGFSI